jgi:hypothetical protein
MDPNNNEEVDEDDQGLIINHENDDEDDDDDDDGEQQQIAWERQLVDFETLCVQIETNDPDLKEYRASYPTINNERATRLGAALLGNTTHLKQLSIHMAWDMTAQGADALVQGILGSHIEELQLSRENHDEMPLDMSQLYVSPMQMVKTLNLAFALDDDTLRQLGQALAGNQTVKSLYLHVEQLSPRGAQFLSYGLGLSRLTTLDMIGDLVDPEAMRFLYHHGIQNCPTIHTLQLFGVLGDMEALSLVLPKLESFTISEIEQGLTVSDVEFLGNGLRLAHKLILLRIWCVGLTDNHVRTLSPILGNHPSLEYLRMRNNAFGDEGVACLVEHWHRDSLISELDLGVNKIGAVGALHLLQALGTSFTKHPNVRTLTLDENRSIGYNGLKLIGKALSRRKIWELNLRAVTKWIDYDDITCDDALTQESQRAQACYALLEGVQGNVFLQHLNVDHNHLPLSVTAELDLYVEANKSGRVLLRQQHRQPPAFWSYFLAEQRGNPSLMFLFLRELPTVMAIMSRR